MKQNLMIGLSLVLLVSAVILIGHDLFRPSNSVSSTLCCGDEEISLKKIDSSQIGYRRVRVLESEITGLSGITVSDGAIYLCGNRVVAVFDTTGDRIGSFATDSVNSCIASDGNTIFTASGNRITGYDLKGNIRISLYPVYKNSLFTSVALAGQFIFAADAINKRVLKYSADGKLLQQIGGKDTIAGTPGFIIPSAFFDISPGGFDDVWIVNPGRREIENYTLSGNMRSSWGNMTSANTGFMGCCNPAHLAVLPDGSFVTYEKGVDKIKVFNATGQFRCYVGGAGSFRGKADYQLGKNNLVKDMATDSAGNIYILDAWNRINIFKPIV